MDLNAHAANLKTYFDKVCDSVDWKAPIDAMVEAKDLAMTIEAIEWFTATPAEVRSHEFGAKFRVMSIGYRAGPAGP